MATYIALLRAVNVLGKNAIKMERLRGICADAGFDNVRTFIASGNAIFETARTPTRWLDDLQAAISEEVGAEISVVVRTPAQLKATVAANPFVVEQGLDPKHFHVTFLSGSPAKRHLPVLAAIDTKGDRYHHVGRELFLHCPNGYARSKLNNNALEKALSIRATTRNWNTVNRLYELAR